jgi:hypothetical protein
MPKKKYKIIIKTSINDRPKDHEISAALILANHYFKSDVTFLRPESNKTPDIEVNNSKWEIKSPMGNGKKTIENNLRAARRQSKHIVIDLRRIKMHRMRAISRIRYFLSKQAHIKRVIIITKDESVIDIL